MFKKNKILIVIFLSLLIVACHDSNESNGNSSESKPKVFEQWSSFHFAERSIGTGVEEAPFKYVITTVRSTLTIDDNNLFEKKDFFNLNEKEQRLTPSYATYTGFYGSNEKHQEYGDHLGKINTSTINQWTFSPTLLNGTGEFNRITKYRVLDIAGQNVLDTFDPNLSIRFNGVPLFDDVYGLAALKFYKKLYSSNFPVGSKCIQLISVEQNSDVLTLERYPEPNVDPYDQNTIKEWWEDSKSQGDQVSIYKDTEAFILDFSNSGAAKVNNTYYWAKPSLKGEVFLFAKTVAKNKEKFVDEEELYESEIKYSEIYDELSKKSCHYFNPEATMFVSKLADL
ncbi:MAG: hypothetical protein ACN6N2_01055 [Acinetobacter calcoaceticus]